VHAKLPICGLGNKLFVWAEAVCFARLNKLPLLVTGWLHPHFRNWIRTGDLRWYWGYFKPWREVSWWLRLKMTIARNRVDQSEVLKIDTPGPDCIVYQFSKVPHWSRYFAQITPYRDLIQQEFTEHVCTRREQESAQVPPPVVCLQVRMGDFRPLSIDEKFAEVGLVRTPVDYYIDFVIQLRSVSGVELPITLISDGTPDELAPLLQLPKVTHTPGLSAIADLLIMSKAKLLVTAAGSTFGQWAGFLGNPILLHHPEHYHFTCRSDDSSSFEGAVWPTAPEHWPSELIFAVRALGDQHRS
jgi:hypothetical protein